MAGSVADARQTRHPNVERAERLVVGLMAESLPPIRRNSVGQLPAVAIASFCELSVDRATGMPLPSLSIAMSFSA